jgi:hypothetical protein
MDAGMPEHAAASPLPVYRDKWLRLLGIPLITAFAYYLTYDDIRFNGWFVYETLSDMAKVFLVWQVVRGCILWLDKVLPWQPHFNKRLAVQVGSTLACGVAALWVLVYLDYALVRPYQLQHFWSFDVVIGLIFLLSINGLYVALYFYDSYLRSVADKKSLERQQEAGLPRGHLLVKVGRQEIRVSYPEIACLYSEAKETYLLTVEAKTYVPDASLDRMEEQLPADLFFRANRQFILTPGLVQSFTTGNHGKLTVHLKAMPKIPSFLTISRDKAPAFRRWLKR